MLNTNTKTREFKFDSIHYIKALFELMKPRVMSLAIFTCVVGFLIAPYKSVDYLYAILSITAVALGSGAAGSLNCWYEADIDKVMSRTCLRPSNRECFNRTCNFILNNFRLDAISFLGLKSI